jgi:hypothetical protein
MRLNGIAGGKKTGRICFRKDLGRGIRVAFAVCEAVCLKTTGGKE